MSTDIWNGSIDMMDKAVSHNNLKNWFHSSMPALLIIRILTVLSGAAGLTCELGWKAFAPTHCCYKVVYSPGISFTNADKECQEEDGRLASVHSNVENDEIFEQIRYSSRRYGEGVWIGYRTFQPNTHNYEWVDASPNDYTNWADGEPNNYGVLVEDCVSMYPRNVLRNSVKKWNDRPCNTYLTHVGGYVCKKCPKLVSDMKHYHALVEELRKHLFSNYSQRVIPTKNRNKPKEVKLVFVVTKLVEVNAEGSTVAVQGMLRVIWEDEYLTWNATMGRYKGIDQISVSKWRIWRPYLTADNSVGATYPFSIKRLRLLNDGRIYQWFRSSVNVSCHMDVSNYPFDKQSCDIWIGVTEYNSTEMIVSDATADVRYGLGGKMPPINGWRLVSVSGSAYYVYYSQETKSFVFGRNLRPTAFRGAPARRCYGSYLIATIELERYNPYFIHIMLVPALFATSLNLVSFMIDSFELSIGILLINFILQTIFALDAEFSIPQTMAMNAAPRLLRYYGFNFVVTALTFLMFIFVHHSAGFTQTRLAEWLAVNSVANSRVLTKVVGLLPRDYEDLPAVVGDRDNQIQTLLHRLKMIGLLVSLIVHFVTAMWLMLQEIVSK